MTELDKKILIILEHITLDNNARLELIKNIIKDTCEKLLPKYRVLYGPQNEAMDISQDDYISTGFNESINEIKSNLKKELGNE